MTRRGAALAVAATFLLAACGGSSANHASTTSTAASTPATTTSSSTTAAVGAGQVAGATTLPASAPRVRLHQVIKLSDPIAMVPRAGSPLLYAAEKTGRVWALRTEGDHLAKAGGEPVLDVSGDITTSGLEQGLLGLTFSPDGNALYIDETAKGGPAGITKVIRYAMSGDEVVPSSATTLLTLAQPYPNHNGGEVTFGPDGALYIGLGDGGSEGDPLNYGQNPNVLFAKILRMNPDGSDRTTWVMGVRNPWRFSFDAPTGDLWIGDVGGSLREEVDHLPGGGPGHPGGQGDNLGWSLREGTIDSGKSGNRNGLVDPVYEYPHTNGACAIVGGFVYRGAAIPRLDGRYVFGDDCEAQVWALDPARPRTRETIASGDEQLTSFATDAAGELFALSLAGPISRIEPST